MYNKLKIYDVHRDDSRKEYRTKLKYMMYIGMIEET